jgi:hypothetical protein
VLWSGGKRVVDEVEGKAKDLGLGDNIFNAFSVVKVEGKYLATLKEALDTPGALPLRAFLKYEGAPSLATGDKAREGFGRDLLDI